MRRITRLARMNAGIKLLVDAPDNSSYPGYTLLLAQALPISYLLRCDDSLLGYGCVLAIPLQVSRLF